MVLIKQNEAANFGRPTRFHAAYVSSNSSTLRWREFEWESLGLRVAVLCVLRCFASAKPRDSGHALHEPSSQMLEISNLCLGLKLWQNFVAEEIELFRIRIGHADDQGVESSGQKGFDAFCDSGGRAHKGRACHVSSKPPVIAHHVAV